MTDDSARKTRAAPQQAIVFVFVFDFVTFSQRQRSLSEPTRPVALSWPLTAGPALSRRTGGPRGALDAMQLLH